ncbi:MAG TPA: cell envelope biogenesis protein TolA [Afifellaceae bacterium]|nr:cell envelope biogenesis protein TolA [Afifellaceae bacterium]
MRIGLGISIGMHVAILAAGIVTLPSAKLLEPDPIEAMPVDLVPIEELTDLRLGDRKAEPVKPPENRPQPKQTLRAPVEQPKPAEKVAKKPVEAVSEPAPTPLPKKVEEKKPEAKTETQVAAIAPPEAEPEPKPEPAKPVEALAPAPVPKVRPKPPKRIEPPKQVAVEKPKKKELSFNTDDIAALLNKRDPAGGGTPTPAVEPQTFGSIEGKATAAMTQSELEALKARLYQCWNPPRGVREARNLRVYVSISLNQDGSLAGPPKIVESGSDTLARVAAESAVRAVQICAPYDFLPPEKYSLWRSINFIFDPSHMLGG